jgi:hypothetical protein
MISILLSFQRTVFLQSLRIHLLSWASVEVVEQHLQSKSGWWCSGCAFWEWCLVDYFAVNGTVHPVMLFHVQLGKHRDVKNTWFRIVVPDGCGLYDVLNDKFFFFFNLFLAALSLCCCAWAFSSCSEQGLATVARGVGFSLWWLFLWSVGSRALVQHVDLVALLHVGSSRTRDWNRVPCIGREILNHWTSREVLKLTVKSGDLSFAGERVQSLILDPQSIY